MKSFIKTYIDKLDALLLSKNLKANIFLSDRSINTPSPAFYSMLHYIRTEKTHLSVVINNQKVAEGGYRVFTGELIDTKTGGAMVYNQGQSYETITHNLINELKLVFLINQSQPLPHDNEYVFKNPIGDYFLNRNTYGSTSINTKPTLFTPDSYMDAYRVLFRDSDAQPSLGFGIILENDNLFMNAENDNKNEFIKMEIGTDILGKDWLKCSDDDKYRVFVIRRNPQSGMSDAQRVYGSFLVSPEIADKKFHRCSVSGYLLTGLSNRYNERREIKNSVYISSYILINTMVQCSGCGEWHNKSEWTAETLRNDTCPVCKKRALEILTDSGVVPVEGLQVNRNTIGAAHHLSSPLQFLNVENDPNPLFLGVELEVDTLTPYEEYDEENDQEGDTQGFSSTQQNTIASHILKKLAPKGSAYAMWDGSLSNGFEIATHPATLKSHLDPTVFNYKGAFDDLVKLGYNSHTAGTCGLHVHINRSFFGASKQIQNLNAGKMAYLLEKHWSEFVGFSRRNSDQLDRWAKVQKLYSEFKSIETAIDNAPISVVGKNKEKGSHLRSLLTKWYPNGEKYVALNTQHANTFEFRIFRGTLRYETYMATLILIDSFARLVANKKVNDLTSVSFSDIINYSGNETIKNYWATRKGGN